MKILVKPYSFDKTNRRISFTSYPSIALENVLLVTNVKDNAIIYNFADSTLGGSLASYNVLQLDYDTSSMANTDPLQIFYDDGGQTVPVNDNGSSLTVDNNGTFAVQATQNGIWNSMATVLNFPATQSVTQGTSPWVTSGLATVTQSGVVHVDDNSSSLTVDNGGTFAVQASQAGTWATNSLATILNFPTNQNVNLQDGSANDISSTGGALDINLKTSDITLNTAVTSAPTISVQGTVTALITSTPTTPVVGTVTANAGTNLNTSALALESGGNLAAIATSLGLLDNTVTSNRLQVDVISAPTISIQGQVSSAVISAPTLFAVVNTGAAGVTSSLATILNFPTTQAITGSATVFQGTSPWVTSGLATVTQSGVVHVDDNSSSLTVDGTVAATQSGTWTVNSLITSAPTLFAVVNTSSAGVTNSLATILNFPASQNVVVTSVPTTSVQGTLAVTQSGTWDEVGINDSGNSITVDNGGTFPVQATQSGTWNVNSLATILNFPATQSVTQGTSPWVTSGLATVTQSGVVHVDDNSSSLTVDGTVAATQSGIWTVNSLITSAPTLFAVVNTGSINLNSGATVNVLNFPATQAVTQSGTWNVGLSAGTNFVGFATVAVSTPTLYAVVNTSAAGTTNSLATVLNFPATQAVTQSGTWNVGLSAGTNFIGFATVAVSTPTLYAVVNTGAINLDSGATVNVMNFPSSQAVTNTGTFAVQASQSGTWTTNSLATVLNFPATQTIAGNATVFAGAAFPITDNSGSLTVDNGGTFAVQVTSAPTISIQGAVSSTIISAPTLFAVVNTGAAGVTDSLATILNFPSTFGVTQSTSPWVTAGLATVTAASAFPVTDNSSSLTVDNGGTFAVQVTSAPTISVQGTLAVTQSGTWDEVGINDSGNSITVDGTVSAAQSGVWTSLATIVNTVTVQDSAAETSLAIMDDWDESDRVKVNSIVGQAGVAAGVGVVDATTQRVVGVNDAGKTLNSTGGVAISSGDNTILASVGSKRKVFAFSISTLSTTDITAIFKSGLSGTELWRAILKAPTGVSTGANLAIAPPAYLFAATSGASLVLNLSSAATVHWAISYFDEA